MGTRMPEARIGQRAYEIYQARGRLPGRDQEDWFQAEREVMQGEASNFHPDHASVLQEAFELDGIDGRELFDRRPTEPSRAA